MSFKEKFDKYELIFTPVLLIFSILVINWTIPQVVPIDNFFDIFMIPSLVGNIIGLLVSILMDKYWKRINNETISSFIRLPTLILIVIAGIASLLISSNPLLALSFIGLGIGALVAVVCFASFLTYFRSYYILGKTN